MNNDDFLAKCRSINPAAEVDRNKNLEAIKIRLMKEEQSIMKNRRIRPAIAAALLAGVMMLSVAAYAAVPAVWRYWDTRVVTGEEFVNYFIIAEFDLPDGTTSVASGIDIDREALTAAGGGVIIVEVEGAEMVFLDELHLDSIDEGIALLELDNVLRPSYLPEGFSFSRFTFPVNPNNHAYSWGDLPTAKTARIYFTNETGNIIAMQIGAMHEYVTLGTSDYHQAFYVDGMQAVLSGGFLSDEQLAAFGGVTLFDGYVFDESRPQSILAGRNDGLPHLVVTYNGVVYGISTDSPYVTAYDLVMMVQSMQ